MIFSIDIHNIRVSGCLAECPIVHFCTDFFVCKSSEFIVQVKHTPVPDHLRTPAGEGGSLGLDPAGYLFATCVGVYLFIY